MKITKRQLRRMIREEKRVLTETMAEWMDYPDIPDYVIGNVIPQLVNMIDAQVTPLSMSPDDIEDIVFDALQDCMADIASRLKDANWDADADATPADLLRDYR